MQFFQSAWGRYFALLSLLLCAFALGRLSTPEPDEHQFEPSRYMAQIPVTGEIECILYHYPGMWLIRGVSTSHKYEGGSLIMRRPLIDQPWDLGYRVTTWDQLYGARIKKEDNIGLGKEILNVCARKAEQMEILPTEVADLMGRT